MLYHSGERKVVGQITGTPKVHVVSRGSNTTSSSIPLVLDYEYDEQVDEGYKGNTWAEEEASDSEFGYK